MYRRFLAFSATILFALLPVVAQANTYHFDDDDTVSRGDFIRAAVEALALKPTSSGELPYLRVPGAMETEVRTAHDFQALEQFGNDLRLAQPIRRGEALIVLYYLSGKRGNVAADYRDVSDGDEEKAVKAALQYDWLDPLQSDYFGTERRLNGSDAGEMLRVLTGPKDNSSVTVGTGEDKITYTVKVKTSASSDLPNMQLMDKVWETVNNDYLHKEDIDETEASYRAIEALVESLGDPYSNFLRPQKAENFNTQIAGEVSGIGAQVETRNGIVTVITPLTGSPAEKAGLKPNDQIIAVDGESIVDLDFLDAVNKIRGPEGTQVTLRVRRSDSTEADIKVTRALVQVPEIEVSWQGRVAVVQLMQFGKRTERELRDMMTEVQLKNPDGVILDLRNNPGGLLDAADIVASNFLKLDTAVATIKMRNSSRYDRTRLAPTILGTVPVVVLVNGGSASASEIVAGALQDAERADVVGTKTFGKGTVQEVLQFTDGSSLKLTVAEWLTPNGRRINEKGIEPDVIVEDDPDTEKDEQLLKALEVIRR